MKTLNRPSESLAGNLELYITPIVNLASIIGQTVTITDEDLLLQLICSRETINHLQTATQTAAGIKYTHKITTLAYGRSDDNDALLELFSIYKLFAIIRNSEGKYYTIGSKDLGLGMEFEYDSGTDPSGVRGYSITLSGDLASQAQLMQYLDNLTGDHVLQHVDPIPE